jgi:hypothetical protein
MTISKKHFEAIAEAIKETKSDLLRKSGRLYPAKPNIEWAIDRLSLRLAKAFSEFNPNFDKERFIKAAEVQDWVIDRAKVAEAKADRSQYKRIYDAFGSLDMTKNPVKN